MKRLTARVSGLAVRTNSRNGTRRSLRFLFQNAPRTAKSTARFVRCTHGTPALPTGANLIKLLQITQSFATDKKHDLPTNERKERPAFCEKFDFSKQSICGAEPIMVFSMQNLRRKCGRAPNKIAKPKSTRRAFCGVCE